MGNSEYVKRKNKRRAVMLQARKRLSPEEAAALCRAIERHQERDRRRTFGQTTGRDRSHGG